MKIVVFEAEPDEQAAFEQLTLKHELTFAREPLRVGNAQQYERAEIVSTFIYSELGSATLGLFPALKLIATRSTGYDHIDLAYCASRNITVCNVPSYGENTVAEHVFALLLAISHHLIDAVSRARSGFFSPQGLQGFDLRGKVIGVIGTGKIGRHVIRIAKGFAMDVLAYDVKPDAHAASELDFSYVDLDTLFAGSDVVTLHVPATAETHHLIDAAALARMKRGVVIINTARGTIIDVAALVEALQSGKVAAAGLDVLPDEPLIREEAQLISSIFRNEHDLRNLVADHVLLHLPNVIVTPHSAFNTWEAVSRIATTTAANIDAFLAGNAVNVVN